MSKVIAKFPKLHDGQLEVKENKARFTVLTAGRRWGKTRLGVNLCLETALAGKKAWWVAPTYAMARVGWRDVLASAQSIEEQYPNSTNIKLAEMTIEFNFTKGGSISVKSADAPSRLRGAGLDYVVMDEAAFCDDSVWAEVLRPTLTERKGGALFISTPNGRDNWFYDLYERANREDEGWKAFHYPTSTSPYIDADELKLARAEIGEYLYLQEYEAEFVSAGTGIVKPEWLRYYKKQMQVDEDKKQHEVLICGDEEVPLQECLRFATVDLAASTKETADYTVIMSVAVTPNKNMCVLNVIRARLEAPDIIPTIKGQITKYGLQYVGIERAGFQLALVQLARREGLTVKELKADRDKLSRALPLVAKMESGQVYFNANEGWCSILERELMQFPDSANDDQVDALAYAVLETQVMKKFVAV